ncbi:hypothetical protein Q4Q35_05785 [Flavivirga aquimarina]|uniref:Secreted protein n=1 Tax=Flavivirga aquimarina TaxID=2027862 RepID=A0ABT8W894_9FLAO|nr:hypothetical protein [Flavivirga aquimarina]MDO5969311.1 hypothetical protein [Flavivirga aquimarina]
MIKSSVLFTLICLLTLGMVATSCSTEDNLTETPTYTTGGELDDPVEPDRDDD